MKASSIPLRTITAPIGTVPELMPLASVKMSGSMPKYSDAVPLPRRPKAVMDLVEDQEDAVLPRDLAQPLEVAQRRAPARAGRARHRLDDHGRDGGRVVQRHDPLELVGEVGTPRGLAPRVALAPPGGT